MPISIFGKPLFNNDYSTQSVREDSGASDTSSAIESIRADIQDTLMDLVSGSTISGEVAQVNDENIILKLSNDSLVEARLSGNANIKEGQKLNFEVSKSGTDKITLRPLYANLSASSAATSALKEANLPINDKTLAMTNRMMLEGMAVNKNALNDMYKDIMTHQNISSDTIVQMNKLGMPLDENNLIQFENYRNFEHSIMGDIKSAAEGLDRLIMDSEIVIGQKSGIEAAAPKENTGIASFAENAAGTDKITDAASGVLADVITDKDGDINQSPGIEINAETKVNADTNVNGDTGLNTNTTVVKSGMDIITDVLDIIEPDTEAEYASKALMGELNDAAQLIKEYSEQAGNNIESSLSSYQQADMPAGEFIKLVKDTLLALSDDANAVNNTEKSAADKITEDISKNGADASGVREKLGKDISDKLSKLVKSDDFKSLVKNSFKSQMTLKAKDVVKNGKIKELYERILKTSNKITQIMESANQAGSEAAKAAANLGDNVSFMNQLNEYVNYVQLPLKMAGENANGELCVYTKKKNLQNNDGNYSALLHLDMEHLGPMDIYVSMRNHTRVNTNFYLESEELLDFIEDHIDELTKRLTEKGYETGVIVSKKDPGAVIKPIADEFTKNEEGQTEGVISKLCFDVRA